MISRNSIITAWELEGAGRESTDREIELTQDILRERGLEFMTVVTPRIWEDEIVPEVKRRMQES
jgi:hypothetical protein